MPHAAQPRTSLEESDPHVLAAEASLEELQIKRTQFYRQINQPIQRPAGTDSTPSSTTPPQNEQSQSNRVATHGKLRFGFLVAKSDSLLGKCLVKFKTVQAFNAAIKALHEEGEAYQLLGKGLIKEAKEACERAAKSQKSSHSIQLELKGAGVPAINFEQSHHYQEGARTLRMSKRRYKRLLTTQESKCMIKFLNQLTTHMEKEWNTSRAGAHPENEMTVALRLRKWYRTKIIAFSSARTVIGQVHLLESYKTGNRERTSEWVKVIGSWRVSDCKSQLAFKRQGLGKFDLSQSWLYSLAIRWFKRVQATVQIDEEFDFEIDVASIANKLYLPDWVSDPSERTRQRNTT